MSEPKSFLKENWSMLIWLLAAVFAAGGIYAEFTSLKMELRMVHERLDKKIILISSLEERVYNLELYGEYEKGLRKSIK
jgi:hypothetical protein|tara:strand:+ start:1811 stop:2047 length:237 start_codon:yes stop_codon:yes gene_type:complete